MNQHALPPRLETDLNRFLEDHLSSARPEERAVQEPTIRRTVADLMDAFALKADAVHVVDSPAQVSELAAYLREPHTPYLRRGTGPRFDRRLRKLTESELGIRSRRRLAGKIRRSVDDRVRDCLPPATFLHALSLRALVHAMQSPEPHQRQEIVLRESGHLHYPVRLPHPLHPMPLPERADTLADLLADTFILENLRPAKAPAGHAFLRLSHSVSFALFESGIAILGRYPAEIRYIEPAQDGIFPSTLPPMVYLQYHDGSTVEYRSPTPAAQTNRDAVQIILSSHRSSA